MKQLLLGAKGCSGRGVRMRLLDSGTRMQIREEAAKELGESATIAQWQAREAVMGIVATVVEVTRKTGFKKADELLSAEWEKVSADDLEKRLADLFCAKDLDALARIFRTLHDVTEKEIEDILGEALDVAEA